MTAKTRYIVNLAGGQEELAVTLAEEKEMTRGVAGKDKAATFPRTREQR